MCVCGNFWGGPVARGYNLDDFLIRGRGDPKQEAEAEQLMSTDKMTMIWV